MCNLSSLNMIEVSDYVDLIHRTFRCGMIALTLCLCHLVLDCGLLELLFCPIFI